MKIKTKMYIGFSILLLIIIGLRVVGSLQTKELNSTYENILNKRYQKVMLSAQIKDNVNAIAKSLRNLTLMDSGERTNLEFDLILKANQDIERKLEQVKTLTISDQGFQLLTSLQKANRDYIRYQDKVISLLKSNQKDEAKKLILDQGRELQNDIFESVDDLVSFNERKMKEESMQSHELYTVSNHLMLALVILGSVLGLGVSFVITRNISRSLANVKNVVTNFADNPKDELVQIERITTDEIGEVASAFNAMAKSIKEQNDREHALSNANQQQTWLKTNVAEITSMLQGIHDLKTLADCFISKITPAVGAAHGAVYLKEKTGEHVALNLFASYAFKERKHLSNSLRIGEGLVGQCARERKSILLTNVPDDYIKINSGLGEATPLTILVLPIVFENEVIAVMEVASFQGFTPIQEQLLEEITGIVGIIFDNIAGRMRLADLLQESQTLTEELQTQSEELQSQQDELKRINEELTEQSDALRAAHELQQRQQEELEQANKELEERTQLLEEQNTRFELKNQEVERAKQKLEEKAQQLALTSQYKSEFLANMSHELRTPLNSLLILARLLMDNKEGNLSVKQIEYCTTIYSSGCDLLSLINEILDLAKVESGKMSVNPTEITIEEIEEFVRSSFSPVAREKGIELITTLGNKLPKSIYTDKKRLLQILNNLLSNAFKFTNEGKVGFDVQSTQSTVSFSVNDSGIGIPIDKQAIIFEAFQQADGTTSRSFGGTGLGLSISRELAGLLGGNIELVSELGVGSTFTLHLPYALPQSQPRLRSVESNAELIERETVQAVAATEESDTYSVADDRGNILESDQVLLIIEDDLNFAKILLDMARERQFKALLATDGDQGLEMANRYLPAAIVLDIRLPYVDGWTVLELLKKNSLTRHIPVHIISQTPPSKRGLKMGAIAHVEKPIGKEQLQSALSKIEAFLQQEKKQVLIVEDDELQRNNIVQLIEDDNIEIYSGATGAEALELLRTRTFDCMVLDIGLSDMSGLKMLEMIAEETDLQQLPIIIYTAKDLTEKEEVLLKKYAESIVIKDARSPERLLNEVTLFLHRVESHLPSFKRTASMSNQEGDYFEGRKILLVDDDIRNVYAISSLLEEHSMEVLFAENGKEGLKILEQHNDIDLVLMDVMMPEMDGYEAMRAIRSQSQFKTLPVIALTAKAMKDDRSKCLQAGASDYITKPVDMDQLLSLMRVWLYKREVN